MPIFIGLRHIKLGEYHLNKLKVEMAEMIASIRNATTPQKMAHPIPTQNLVNLLHNFIDCNASDPNNATTAISITAQSVANTRYTTTFIK